MTATSNGATRPEIAAAAAAAGSLRRTRRAARSWRVPQARLRAACEREQGNRSQQGG